MEDCKALLEIDIKKKLADLGIKEENEILVPLDEIPAYLILDSEEAKKKFTDYREEIYYALQVEIEVCGEGWSRAFYWFVDRVVYTFLNRLFAIRILEAFDLLKESTFVPQADHGALSARMKKIQEQFPDKMNSWQELMLRDVFSEIGQEVSILFDDVDITSRIWPNITSIEQITQKLNALDTEIYKAEDCIGWFYHYYVLKNRKEQKTMSHGGSKHPVNPYYLSILNTVYTPRWMVRVLVDNSLGHWWQDTNQNSKIFSESPFFISKVPVSLKYPTEEPANLRILDPACGSGNFLVYTFRKLVEIYKERYPHVRISQIIESILNNNLFGIDINRRPAQLTALALFIMAKNTIKQEAPVELAAFKMPTVNILCCDIRLPPNKNRVLFIQQFKDTRIQKVIKDIVEQFDNADQLGSLIDIQSLQIEVNKIKKEKKIESKKHLKLDLFMPNGKKMPVDDDSELDLVSVIESEALSGLQENIGMQLFGRQARNAASLAQVLMQKYDIILGNPPFGFSMDATKQKLRKFYPNTYSDLVSAFIDQSSRLLKNDGAISMVSDFSFMHLPKFEKFREKVLLKNLYIQYLLVTGLAALPDARNVPILFVLRKNSSIEKKEGLYRYVEYSSSQQFVMDVYIKDIMNAIKTINLWSGKGNLPRGWNRIDQDEFLALPRCVIDLSLAEKFSGLLSFFKKFPRLDISQMSEDEQAEIPEEHLARAYQGIATGNNDVFVKLWFEVNINQIRIAENISSISEVTISKDQPFVPFSKGGGDMRYYLSNPFILWWNKAALKEMENYDSVIRNPSLATKSQVNWSLHSGIPRGRFSISQKNILRDVATMGILIQHNKLNKFSLMAYLNSKLGCFFGRLQTKARMWQAGIIARFPVPIEFLENEGESLTALARESFELRRDWDTCNPSSPIFVETLIDRIIRKTPPKKTLDLPKTNHPFCEEYEPSKSIIAEKIRDIKVELKNVSIEQLLDTVEMQFKILVQRLDEIDDAINKFLYESLLDAETGEALDEYYNTFVGKLSWQAERNIWLKDFVMNSLLEVINASPKGIIPLDTFKESELGLYDQFVGILCKKFDRDLQGIQKILKDLELEQHLGKDLKRWIADDFFFYHCERYGGRPIVWQFYSRSKTGRENALDIFVDYHRITENTLPNIRVDFIEPILRAFERRKTNGTLPIDDIPKCDELDEFIKTFTALESGYKIFPSPNTLTGNKSAKGKGDDKTWGWVFSESAKIIKDGYKPDHFRGVLVNIIPLCLDLPEVKQKGSPIEYRYICPKGTIKHVLKKIDTLDQLRQNSTKEGLGSKDSEQEPDKIVENGEDSDEEIKDENDE